MSSKIHQDDSKNMAILTDTNKCVGCQKCVAACVDTNKTGDPIPYIYDHPDGLSGTRWTAVLKIEDQYVRKQCLHCVEPSCVSACLVHALDKHENGAVTYNKDKCIGCRYCMLACPFKIPRYQWNTPVPFINKCILCYESLLEGKQPACTGACPYGATIFGTRKEMLAEAQHRIDAEPDKYKDRIWGEHDFGGTSVIYISSVSLGGLGFPTSEKDEKWKHTSIPESVQAVTKAPLFILGGVYSSLAVTSWVLNRRIKLAEEKEKLEKKNEKKNRAGGH